MVTSLYKILAKILANRLCEVLDNMISISQGAFARGRQILHMVLIANEVVEYRSLRKSGDIFKIDLEKAYNSIAWDFLDFVLEKKGIWS